MNSASSNRARLRRQTPAPAASASQAAGKRGSVPPPPPRAAEGGLRPVHVLILATTCAASAGALLAHGSSVPNIVFVVLTIVAAGVAAGGIYRTLSPLTAEAIAGEPEMVGGRTRAALEREKTIVLRAIKELEFDRAMGKVSAADCDEMIGRLRGRAVRLIRQLDAGSAGYQDLIERELNARLSADSK